MADLIRDALSKELGVDGLVEAEKITGKSYKEDKATEALGLLLHINNVRDREALLHLSQDTTYNDTVERYLSIAQGLGFEIVFQEQFMSPSGFDDVRVFEETQFILFDRKRAILLNFDTYMSKNVNGGHFYYNWKSNSKNPWPDLPISGGCEGTEDNYVHVGHMDCREALKYNIEELERQGKFVNPWPYQNNISLTRYQDWKDYKHLDTPGNYKVYYRAIDELCEARFNKLPDFVKQAVKAKWDEWK